MITQGYLEQDYLATPYLAETAQDAYGMQVLRTINASKAIGSQVSRSIVDHLSPIGSQVSRQITGQLDPVHSQADAVISTSIATVRSQASRTINALSPIHIQVNRQIVDHLSSLHSQVDRAIAASLATGMQVADAVQESFPVHSQVNRTISNGSHATGMQILVNTFLHELCEEYLIKPYLATPYLANDICAHGRLQVSRVIANHLSPFHMQVSRAIASTKLVHMQAHRQINLSRPFGSQVARVFAAYIHSQVTMVLYNTTNLRILKDFPSRGNGTNWTASSTATGDFSPNNLNTDIVEQVWRSDSGMGTSFVLLECDTGLTQGVFIDTLAILNHNFTKSAVIVLQGSNDPLFGVVNLEITLDVTLQNMYYIAPLLPNAGYRYYRFVMEDPTNTAGFLQVGTIVFGASIIFVGDDIALPITFGRRHFKDTIVTEGFTSVSNDRALKNYVKLHFRDMDFHKGNYTNLTNLFQTARTSLKCLWIPTPRYPSRFAVFGKLAQIPEESHVDHGEEPGADTISLDTEVDESL